MSNLIGGAAMTGVRQFNEDHLVDAVLDVFWRKGLRETTMQDLAAAADVQRGSLYNAYGDKEALFLLAFDRYATRFMEAVRGALNSESGAEALGAFFNTAIANMTAGTPARGCLTTRTALDAALSSNQVRERVQALLNDLESALKDAFSREEIRKQLALEPAPAALVVLTFTRGLAVLERAFQNPAQLQTAARALIETLFLRARKKAAAKRRAA
jgi:AcrR family transcriptional regulator